ncbi:hypothetical protein BKA82DRAFT_4177599 [Pisolithus tinctorius]|nr:hypothetical protein BKA82DRAFT_4177599 [Pisolithus tinctorius]
MPSFCLVILLSFHCYPTCSSCPRTRKYPRSTKLPLMTTYCGRNTPLSGSTLNVSRRHMSIPKAPISAVYPWHMETSEGAKSADG